MVIIDTSFQKMQKLVKGKITLEELEQTLANLGMELNEAHGDELKIEITAERTDLITAEGLVRAINSYNGFVKGYAEINVIKSDYLHLVDPSVKKIRPFTRSFVVKNLDLTSEDVKSLMQVQEKIHDTYGRKRKKVSLGLYNLDLIAFPVKYCAKKPEDIKFIPLGLSQEMNGAEILKSHPKGKEYAFLLENLSLYPLQIDHQNQVLSLPPIINSNNLGNITEKTKNIFVESTGSDEDALDNIMNILATMFHDLGGKVFTVTIKDENKEVLCPNLKEKQRSISVDYIQKITGLNLKPQEAANLLLKMEYNLVKIKGKEITVSIPSIRTDIWHQVDLADDVARGYGYNFIKPTLPNLSTIGKMLPLNILIDDLCNYLVGLELIEVKTFALTNHLDQYGKMNLEEQKHISLGKNTQDKNLSMVRSWLIPEMMKALVANRNSEYPQRIFEIGTIVLPDETADVRAKNVTKLACLLCEDKTDFTKIKQVLDSVMNFLGLKYHIKESLHSSFIRGRVGEICLQEKRIGFIGELHPQVLTNWELMIPTVGLEIDLEEIFRFLSSSCS